MRKIMSALSVTALVVLSLGLTAPLALADPAPAVTIPCGDVFGPDTKGKIMLKQNDDKVTLSVHCNTDLVGPEHAVEFECSIVDPDVKGHFVITPSGNFEGHCSVPL
jgi:hypothetical protein